MVQMTDYHFYERGNGHQLPHDRAMLEDGVYQTARPRPITRGGGPADYFEITEDQRFRMGRPG